MCYNCLLLFQIQKVMKISVSQLRVRRKNLQLRNPKRRTKSPQKLEPNQRRLLKRTNNRQNHQRWSLKVCFSLLSKMLQHLEFSILLILLYFSCFQTSKKSSTFQTHTYETSSLKACILSEPGGGESPQVEPTRYGTVEFFSSHLIRLKANTLIFFQLRLVKAPHRHTVHRWSRPARGCDSDCPVWSGSSRSIPASQVTSASWSTRNGRFSEKIIKLILVSRLFMTQVSNLNSNFHLKSITKSTHSGLCY